MGNKFSTIKERILQYGKYQGIGHKKFAIKIGMTYGSFTGDAINSSINSSAIDNLLSLFPEINLHWLFTEEGEMDRETSHSVAEPGAEYKTGKEAEINLAHQKHIATQGEYISMLKSKISDLEKELDKVKDEKKPDTYSKPSEEKPV